MRLNAHRRTVEEEHVQVGVVEWGLLGAVTFVRECVAGQSRSCAGGHRSFTVMGVGPGCGVLRVRIYGTACRVT